MASVFRWEIQELENAWYNALIDVTNRDLHRGAKFLHAKMQEAVSIPFPPASKAGEPPRLRTGIGRWSIKLGRIKTPRNQPDIFSISVHPKGWYMAVFETTGFPDRNIAPRPWLEPTLRKFSNQAYAIMAGQK